MTAQAGSASSLSAPAAASAMTARNDLRRLMRTKRQSLSPAARLVAAEGIAKRLIRARLLRRGHHVGVYLGVRGEAGLGPLIDRVRRLGCHLYLPRIVSLRSGRMEFLRFTSFADLKRNRLGILEPDRAARRIAPRALDRVLVPLLAFDEQGHRLGMGGGFYDRRFAFLRPGRHWRRPRLIGIAYDLQRVRQLDPHPWDVPLDAVVTEQGLYRTPAP